MLTSLRTIIKECDLEQGSTLYANVDPKVLDWKMNTADFWTAAQLVMPREEKPADKAQTETVDKIAAINRQIRQIKEVDDKEHKQVDLVLALRKRKKKLESEIVREPEIRQTVIQFKKTLTAVDFTELVELLPMLESVNFSYHDQMPYFVANMEAIARAVKKNEEVAVTGGPCLFGLNEVDMNIALWDGNTQTFDYSTGRHFVQDGCHMTEYIKERAEEIADVTFVNHKSAVTSQEYDSILYLFELAKSLNAKLTIPIPDMSYVKYLKGMYHYVGESLREIIVRRFREFAYVITDMYLDVINELHEKYPEVEYTVIHERDEEKCRIFYEKREQYIEVQAILRKITGITEKTEAIKDYISMPALPYYIYGIKNIVQVDSIDETDSYRKCRLAHKNVMELSGILYPERISRDGENAIFFTTPAYKEYRQGR
jgi:hypothetical protein